MTSGRAKRSVLVAAAWQVVGVLAGIAPALAEAQRVVSLNLCTDQLVVDLVEPSRIAGVTELARDPLSTPVPERARELPVTSAVAEDVIARRPDLVLASPFTSPATLDLLRRTGHSVVTVGAGQNLAGVRDAIASTARAVGAVVRGEALVAEINAALARNTPLSDARPSALVLQPNNFASERGGLVSELLAAAGFRNHIAVLGVGATGQVDVEMIVTHPPDVLILASGPGDYASVVADNLRHPALAALVARTPTAVIPWSGWLCGTHHVTRVLDDLGTLYRRVVAGGARG